MTISHQTLLDEDGNPTAALIPWEEFLELQSIHEYLDIEVPLSDEYKAELQRRIEGLRNGTSKGIPHEKVMSNLRATLKKLDRDAEKRSA